MSQCCSPCVEQGFRVDLFFSLTVAVYLQWAVNHRGRLREHLTKLAKQVCALSRLFSVLFSLLLFILLSLLRYVSIPVSLD